MSYQFHGISRTEFQNLVNFLTAKGLPMGEVDANALADRLIDEDDMAGIATVAPPSKEVRMKTKTPRKTKILKAPRTRTVVNQPIRVLGRATRTRRIQRMVVKRKNRQRRKRKQTRALQPRRKRKTKRAETAVSAYMIFSRGNASESKRRKSRLFDHGRRQRTRRAMEIHRGRRKSQIRGARQKGQRALRKRDGRI